MFAVRFISTNRYTVRIGTTRKFAAYKITVYYRSEAAYDTGMLIVSLRQHRYDNFLCNPVGKANLYGVLKTKQLHINIQEIIDLPTMYVTK